MIYMPTSLADAPQKLADAWGYSFLSGLICLAVGQFILIMYPTKLATQSEGFWESCPQAVRKLFRKASGTAKLIGPNLIADTRIKNSTFRRTMY